MTIHTGLTIFDPQPLAHVIDRSYFAQYHPISDYSNNGPIEFSIAGSNEEYIDCNDIYLYIQLQVVKKDGTDLDSTVIPANSFHSSLFSDVVLKLNEKQIDGGQDSYAYKSYLSYLLQYDKNVKASHLELVGWTNDGEEVGLDNATNKGLLKRSKWIETSRVFELYGPVNLDLFRQGRYLLSHVDLRLNFKRTSSEFVLSDYAAKPGSYKINILKAVLEIRRAVIVPMIINAHAKGILERNAIYPVNHTRLITFTIPTGATSYIKSDLFSSQKPKLLFIAMIENSVYNGDIQKNPFNFINLNKLSLFDGGNAVMGEALEPNFAKKLYARTYVFSSIALNQFNSSDNSNGITYDMFGNGFTIYAFDLTADNQVYAEHSHGVQPSNLRLDLAFDTALPETINVLLFGVFDSAIEITASRDILMHYTR